MAKSRKRSIYPILLIVLINGLVMAGAVVPLVYYGFDSGPPVDLAAAGWAGWAALLAGGVGTAILVVGGVILRAIPKIPALVMAVFPATVTSIGLIGAQLGARVVLGVLGSAEPSEKARLVGVGMSDALNASVIATYVAAALMMGGSLTIALRHWPSRSSLSSGGKLGLMGGAFILVGMIVGSLFWQPLRGLGMIPWITTFVGLAAIAMAAHAIRNDPTEKANVQAAGELWVTMLLSVGALVLVCSASHTSVLMSGLAAFKSTQGAPNIQAMTQSWTAAEPALYAGALYAIPLLFSSVASMLSRGSLGSWGMRNAGASILVVPFFFITPSALQYAQTWWVANQVSKYINCSASVNANADLTLPTVVSAQSCCPTHALEVGRSSIHLAGKKIGSTKQLGTQKGCAQVARAVEGTPGPVSVAVDQTVSYQRVACLVDALGTTRSFAHATAAFAKKNPQSTLGRNGPIVHWVAKEPSHVMSHARAPFDQVGVRYGALTAYGPCAGGWDEKMARLHLFEGGWEYQRGPRSPKIRFEGSSEEGIERLKRALGVNMRSQVLVISAEGNVLFGTMALYMSQFKVPQLAAPNFGESRAGEVDADARPSGDGGEANSASPATSSVSSGANDLTALPSAAESASKNP